MLRSLRHLSVLSLIVALLTGCASMPKSIQGNTPAPLENYTAIMAGPNQYVGKEARLGGKVVGITNDGKQTQLEITSMQLDSVGRPILNSISTGRILAHVNAFLDPADFKDKLVTVVGRIAGVKQGSINKNTTYDYLLINVTGFQRWQITQQIVMPPVPTGPWYWRNGYYNPAWGGPMWYQPGPAQVQTIVTE